jgi:urease accessory protein
MISSSAVVAIVQTVRPIRCEGNWQLVHDGTSAGVLRAGALRRGSAAGADDRVVLDYRDRFLRRRRLVTVSGAAVLVDLPETVSLDDGDALVLDDGRLVAVEAAAEPLLEVSAPPHALARLAWHIGNRHMPAEISPDRILVQRDSVIEDMLARLGAVTRPVEAPFRPEGGAYGRGRTHGHRHGAADDPEP